MGRMKWIQALKVLAAKDRDFTVIIGCFTLLALMAVINHPAVLLSKQVQGGVGWVLAGALGAAGLCFTMAPALPDIPQASASARRAGAQFAVVALLLTAALAVGFIATLASTALIPNGGVHFVIDLAGIVKFLFYAVPATIIEFTAFGVGMFACINLARAAKFVLFPEPAPSEESTSAPTPD